MSIFSFPRVKEDVRGESPQKVLQEFQETTGRALQTTEAELNREEAREQEFNLAIQERLQRLLRILEQDRSAHY